MEGWWTLVAIGSLVGLAFGPFGAWIAVQKGRDPLEGAAIGFLFGPIGALVEALLPDGRGTPGPRDEVDDEQEKDDPKARALLREWENRSRRSG